MDQLKAVFTDPMREKLTNAIKLELEPISARLDELNRRTDAVMRQASAMSERISLLRNRLDHMNRTQKEEAAILLRQMIQQAHDNM